MKSLRRLRRGTTTCPAVLKSLSTDADDGSVVLNLLKTFWILRYISSALSLFCVCVTQVVDTFLVNSILCYISCRCVVIVEVVRRLPYFPRRSLLRNLNWIHSCGRNLIWGILLMLPITGPHRSSDSEEEPAGIAGGNGKVTAELQYCQPLWLNSAIKEFLWKNTVRSCKMS